MTRKRNRTGPKRKAGPREPNGRASRKKQDVNQRTEETEMETMSTAVCARQRLYGMTREEALRNQLQVGRPNAGSLIGRMALQGVLTFEQWAAGVKWQETRANYHKAIQARGEASGGGTRRGGEDSDAYVAWCKAAIEKHDEMQDRLQDVSNHTRSANIPAAMHLTISREEEYDHLLGDLRTALNALVRLWGLDSRKAA